MIVVTGTMRSGTSMWMQVLAAAGFRTVGRAFPARWAETLRAANPDGFFESRYRGGIYHATNPDPKTGRYHRPDETRHLVAKVFIPGVEKSDVAFLDHVLVSVRPFREYAASRRRLDTLERANRTELGIATSPPESLMDPTLEWWDEMHRVIANALVRGLPVHFVAYERVLGDPRATIGDVLRWIGAGDLESAVSCVKPEHRTQRASETPALPEGMSERHVQTFDALYRRIAEGGGLDGAFIDELNDTAEALAPLVRAERTRVRDVRRLARQAR